MSSGWIVEPLRVEGQEMSLVWYITKVISYFLISFTLTLWETHRPNVQRALFWIRSKPNYFQVLVEVCFCVRRYPLTMPLSNQEYGWVAMNSQGS